MTDSLTQVFAALADPTRRDLVARLTVGDATVGQLAAPYDVSVQAISKHLKVLEEAGLVSRSAGGHRSPVHLEAEVFDLMTKWIERYRQRAEDRYQRLDAVLAELDDAADEPEHRPTARRRQHDHHDADGDDRGRSERSRSSASPGTSRPPRPSCSGRTPTPRCSRDGSARTGWTTTVDRWDARDRGQLALRGRPGRERVRLPRLLPRGPAGPDRADLHVGGRSGRRRAGDPPLRGPRRRPHPAARPVALRLLRGPRRLAPQRDGGRRRPGLRLAGRPARRRRGRR